MNNDEELKQVLKQTLIEEGKHNISQNTNESKSDFLSTIDIIVLVIAVIGGLVQFFLNMYIGLAVTVGSCIVIFIFTKICRTIIDLLQSIDEKLTK